MPPSVKFKSKIFLPTPRYDAQQGVDSALYLIFKIAVVHESRDPGAPFKEKKLRVENLVILSL
jgi:hypothetical protein